jgi:hypothetical protein
VYKTYRFRRDRNWRLLKRFWDWSSENKITPSNPPTPTSVLQFRRRFHISRHSVWQCGTFAIYVQFCPVWGLTIFFASWYLWHLSDYGGVRRTAWRIVCGNFIHIAVFVSELQFLLRDDVYCCLAVFPVMRLSCFYLLTEVVSVREWNFLVPALSDITPWFACARYCHMLT